MKYSVAVWIQLVFFYPPQYLLADAHETLFHSFPALGRYLEIVEAVVPCEGFRLFKADRPAK